MGMPRWTRRAIAAGTSLVVLALALGGVMRERCLMPGSGACCPPAVLAFTGAGECPACMAPGGPEVASSDVASRWQERAPVFLAIELPVVRLRPPVAALLTKPAPFRSDQVPLTLQNRVLRI